jgi:hypothetical protein
MLIGYARVSTGEQDTAAQRAALKAAGCELIFSEKASGGRWDRPELHKLLSQLRKSDVLVVWKLDRLSRSLHDVLTIMERVKEKKAGFRSLTEAVDTTTPAGRMMMQMVGAFATRMPRPIFKKAQVTLGCLTYLAGGRGPSMGGAFPVPSPFRLRLKRGEPILCCRPRRARVPCNGSRSFRASFSRYSPVRSSDCFLTV